MKESLEVVFLNELNVNIFDEYFYKNLLNSIVNLLQKKSIKVENEIMTCACLEQELQSNGSAMHNSLFKDYKKTETTL